MPTFHADQQSAIQTSYCNAWEWLIWDRLAGLVSALWGVAQPVTNQEPSSNDTAGGSCVLSVICPPLGVGTGLTCSSWLDEKPVQPVRVVTHYSTAL